MSLYRMLFGEFFYLKLEQANPQMSAIFFFCYIIGFFLILQNLLIAILSTTYDALRYKYGLDSMAQAKKMSKEQQKFFLMWFNLIFCRMEAKDKPPIY